VNLVEEIDVSVPFGCGFESDFEQPTWRNTAERRRVIPLSNPLLLSLLIPPMKCKKGARFDTKANAKSLSLLYSFKLEGLISCGDSETETPVPKG
jgi:hypothetical protein